MLSTGTGSIGHVNVFTQLPNSKRYRISLLVVAAFSLWLRTGFPVYALGHALHDDMLFVQIARHLEAGQMAWALRQFDAG